MRRAWLLCSLLAGCAPEAPQCATADDQCPIEAPFEGTPCIGALSCEYPHPDDPSHPIGLRTDCIDGRWRDTILCPSCPLREVERCRDPDPSPIDGAITLTLSDDPVRFGAQGAAMLAHTLSIEGLEDRERCVRVRERTFIDGMPAPASFSVRLRCGGSQPILGILYDLPCDPGVHRLEVEAEVEGVEGTARIGLDFDGADCPRDGADAGLDD